ncbi:zinc finger CCCH domain-containing protein 23-like [Hibiscus syriacus]|uniref:zinc finger CCCH domain-containing protein 23-like n=1 Tax=Hibiscus syriacus TaxID=106335 RepID=UPI0019246F2A|nr:zinc finger CCCH domain-containing protein 23-like [Hibiscus syriacus]
MDLYEATRIVLSRIQSLDPDNASKIMGYLLIQDHGEKEMIRLAFGPEAHIHSLILKAKTHLGLSSSNPPTPSAPLSPSPLSSKPTPLSIPSSPFSYASIVNRSSAIANDDDNEFIDDHLSFLNDSKPEDLFSPRLDLAMPDSVLHRRSFSVPGMCFGAAADVNSGIGWKPCLYFARGFCKNGTSCRFLHGDCADGGAALVGSPSMLNELEQHYQELLRSKALQQQEQNLASASQFMPGTSFPYIKSLNSYGRSAMAALMTGDELHKLGRCRPERNDFSGSRQIYLTFPADSSFKEEDVSNYFSIYGPVQDVRIPYQQKRMFGFVTFVYPETVRLILAKGNPHFICDSRVLVKPYKEKGKVQEKKQLERGEFSTCWSPSAIDSREPFDLHLGSKMFYNTQEMLLRRKMEEQADLQQAIELQGRRLLNLQLLDLKNQHQSPFHHDLSTGSPIPSPTVPRTPNNHALIFPADGINQEVPEENGGCTISAVSKLAAAMKDDKQMEDNNAVCNYKNGNGNSNTKGKANTEETDVPECLEHVLPDNLFTSPKKSAGDHLTSSSPHLQWP